MSCAIELGGICSSCGSAAFESLVFFRRNAPERDILRQSSKMDSAELSDFCDGSEARSLSIDGTGDGDDATFGDCVFRRRAVMSFEFDRVRSLGSCC